MVPVLLLAACRAEEQPETPAEPIRLQARVVESDAAAETKAGAEDHHARHLTLEPNTVLALRISGTWTGHSPSNVVQTTTATIGSVADDGTDNKHNELSCNPVRYWDDYGTADPANEATGRAEGLTIYGAAINGDDTLSSDLNSIKDGETDAGLEAHWTGLSWTVPADQRSGWSSKDLLISNNVKGVSDPYENDYGRYLFEHRDIGKILEFNHALSKITVNLRAGQGFSGSAFIASPTVQLINNWAYTTGTVDITTGGVSGQSGATVIQMYQAATPTTDWNATMEALVIPGSAFASDAAEILKINADGNIYYVTAEKIRTAINASTHATDGPYTTEPGKNYVFNVIVNKTDVVVTATLTNWTNVNSAEVAPVINVSADWGASGSASNNTFSFYRSTSPDDGYSADKDLVDSRYYPAESVIAKDGDNWTMTPQLYWPDHYTHYQFRGVWPQTESVGGPRVEAGEGATVGCQVIKVTNQASYSAGTFPSDLQIARPEVAEDATCTNTEPGHTTTNLWTGGICATEGTINMNFRYMMCQVQVNLTTTEVSALNDHVSLSGAVVEIINVYLAGDVKLGDRSVVPTGAPNPNGITMGTMAGEGNEDKRLSAIVPQPLTYTTAQASTNLRFRITIYNGPGSFDVYYADVAPILKTGSSDLVAPTGRWESGVHYIYNLKLSKTKVNVSATLADWTPVNADENVWF